MTSANLVDLQIDSARLNQHRKRLDESGEVLPAAICIKDRDEVANTLALFSDVLAHDRYSQSPVIEIPGLRMHWLGGIGIADAVDFVLPVGNVTHVITLQVPGWVPFVPRERPDANAINTRCAEAIHNLEHARGIAAHPLTILDQAIKISDLRQAIESATSAMAMVEDALADASDTFPRWSRPPRGTVPRVAGFAIKWRRV